MVRFCCLTQHRHRFTAVNVTQLLNSRQISSLLTFLSTRRVNGLFYELSVLKSLPSACCDASYFHFLCLKHEARTLHRHDTKASVQTVAVLVFSTSPLNTKEAHGFLLTRTSCTYRADSTELVEHPSLASDGCRLQIAGAIRGTRLV